MKYFKYLVFLTASFPVLAQAADKTDGVSSSIAVEKILCRPAMIHTPSSDTNYKPGVDVNGNPVAAADLDSNFQATSTTYTEVPLNIDLARKLSLPLSTEMETNIGNLKVYRDGHVTYNDQDITQQADMVCGRAPTPVPVPQPRMIQQMPTPDIPQPGSAAPSGTTLVPRPVEKQK